uniref:Uncharacterized protein n=1 Tax=Gadus morhua TaxID=8049 RepID=A0A8C5C6I1_GADMO
GRAHNPSTMGGGACSYFPQSRVDCHYTLSPPSGRRRCARWRSDARAGRACPSAPPRSPSEGEERAVATQLTHHESVHMTTS